MRRADVFLRLRGLRGISLLLIRLRYPYASASSNSVSRGQTHWIDGTPLLTKRSDQGATVVAMTAIAPSCPTRSTRRRAQVDAKRTLFVADDGSRSSRTSSRREGRSRSLEPRSQRPGREKPLARKARQ